MVTAKFLIKNWRNRGRHSFGRDDSTTVTAYDIVEFVLPVSAFRMTDKDNKVLIKN